MKSMVVFFVLVASVNADCRTNKETEDLKREMKSLRQYVEVSRKEDRRLIRSLQDQVRILEQRYEDLYKEFTRFLVKHATVVDKLKNDNGISRNPATTSGFGNTVNVNHTSHGLKNIPKKCNEMTTSVASIPKLEASRAKKKSKRVNTGSIQRPTFHFDLVTSQSNLGDGQVVLFDGEFINIGNDYSKETGAFTCSTAGVYFFTWSIGVNPGKHVETMLVHNGFVRGVLGVSGGTNQWDTGSQTVILSLDVGDVVMVKVSTLSANHDDGASLSYGDSSFSGFLLF